MKSLRKTARVVVMGIKMKKMKAMMMRMKNPKIIIHKTSTKMVKRKKKMMTKMMMKVKLIVTKVFLMIWKTVPRSEATSLTPKTII